MDGIMPSTLVDKNDNPLLTNEQITNFDTYIGSLHSKGYIKKLRDMRAFEDVTGCYYFEMQPEALSYFDDKKAAELQEKKDRRSSIRRDLLMMLIGAVIGAVLTGVVELILFKCFGIGG